LTREDAGPAGAGRGGGGGAPQLLRQLGDHPDGGAVGLYRGRYGPYVSHEGLIASLPKGAHPDRFNLADALPLLVAQKAKGKTARKARFTRSTPAAANGTKRGTANGTGR